ncbi:MAG TPA: zinc ribbon domain-containing protein [Candidatus Acidoferrales bacterium]|jgi:hypothetical protein|nr:zinc ribbon domain-containing protein [Candidatus Acidoferrales bacterium]
MNCPACGNPVEKDAAFCPKCYGRIERPGWLGRVVAFFQELFKPGPHTFTLNIKKTVTIKSVGKDGSTREFKSLAEAPLELQLAVEKMQAEVMKELGGPPSAETLVQQAANPGTPGLISRRTFEVYKVKDASGQERTYHSLEELPPKMQEALRRAQGLSGPVSWRGKTIRVRAIYIPRFLWTTASIDVYLDGERVFRTGGQLKSTGAHSAVFRSGGSEFKMELKWGRSAGFGFPYQLRIEGEPVDEALVRVENPGMMLIPALLIVGSIVVFLAGLTVLMGR